MLGKQVCKFKTNMSGREDASGSCTFDAGTIQNPSRALIIRAAYYVSHEFGGSLALVSSSYSFITREESPSMALGLKIPGRRV